MIKQNYVAPFRQTGPATTQTLTTSSQTFNLNRSAPLESRSIRIVNKGPDYSYIEFGSSGVSAASSRSLIILPDSIEVFGVRDGETHIAVICEGATNTLQFCEGVSS